ncbi:unnamed protein product [Moneuplotes crassus]|uniref:Uncharacterized protein n=1 Tax=Euplotes crassus TaxID=5936 RepID=A0AAD1XWW6_EUPCR|nr:unnamed protein product [Moneuplotes crassus]
MISTATSVPMPCLQTGSSSIFKTVLRKRYSRSGLQTWSSPGSCQLALPQWIGIQTWKCVKASSSASSLAQSCTLADGTCQIPISTDSLSESTVRPIWPQSVPICCSLDQLTQQPTNTTWCATTSPPPAWPGRRALPAPLRAECTNSAALCCAEIKSGSTQWCCTMATLFSKNSAPPMGVPKAQGCFGTTVGIMLVTECKSSVISLPFRFTVPHYRISKGWFWSPPRPQKLCRSTTRCARWLMQLEGCYIKVKS